jgi:alpha-ketoglutarate-dependent taurine dioxygenase
LTDLTLVNCTGTSETALPQAYVAVVFSHLPATVMFVDGYRNPRYSAYELVASLPTAPTTTTTTTATDSSSALENLQIRRRYWYRELAMHIYSLPEHMYYK